MSYPYRHPDPFAKALRYDYADVKEDVFFMTWQERRSQCIESLKSTQTDAAEFKKQKMVVEGRPLHEILRDIEINKDYKNLLRFIKKFEIFGKLYTHYDHDYRKSAGADPALLSDYIEFAKVIVKACEAGENLQYLSTLLKLCDVFCSLKINEIESNLKAQLIDVLRAEHRLVLGIYGEAE